MVLALRINMGSLVRDVLESSGFNVFRFYWKFLLAERDWIEIDGDFLEISIRILRLSSLGISFGSFLAVVSFFAKTLLLVNSSLMTFFILPPEGYLSVAEFDLSLDLSPSIITTLFLITCPSSNNKSVKDILFTSFPSILFRAVYVVVATTLFSPPVLDFSL